MITFNGIHNDNGVEKKVRIYIDLDAVVPYTTDFYIGNKRLDAKIENNICTIRNNDYIYVIERYQNEIIIVFKETNGFLHYIFPCFCRQKFFVVSNKEEV